MHEQTETSTAVWPEKVELSAGAIPLRATFRRLRGTFEGRSAANLVQKPISKYLIFKAFGSFYLPPKAGVAGSIPAGRTKNSLKLRRTEGRERNGAAFNVALADGIVNPDVLDRNQRQAKSKRKSRRPETSPTANPIPQASTPDQACSRNLARNLATAWLCNWHTRDSLTSITAPISRRFNPFS